MTNWRSRALLGASAAAVLIALVPFSAYRVSEREVLSRIAGAPSAVSRATLPPVETLAQDMAALVRRGIGAPAAVSTAVVPPAKDGAVETLAQDMAALVRRGIDAAARGGAPAEQAPEFPQIPSEVASSEAEQDAAARRAPQLQPVLLSPAAQAYRKGDVAALETLAAVAGDPDERLALEWAALRADPHPTFAALEAFAKAHPTWPGLGYVRFRQEADLLVHPPSPSTVAEFFAAEPPQSSAGKLAAARAKAANGRVDEAIRTVRELWRDGNLDAWTESAILRDFGVVLLKSDHKYRADRLLYAESYAAAFRAAALAGPDEMALAKARYAAARGPLGPALLKAVPASLKNDPSLLFARIQDARRSDRAYEATMLLNLAPKDPEALVSPDKWWSERRMVARELLDLNEPKLAFELCDKAAQPDDSADKVDLDFHAGWIALRFLGDAREAAKRFALAAEAAETPLSIARAEYWRGRASDAMGDADEAKLHYEDAATEPIAYYGQLAAQRLGAKRLELRAPSAVAKGAERDESVRAAEALYALGLDDLATALAFEAARNWRDEAQMAAMAEVVKRHADAAIQVQFGKIATLRGYAFDAMAFPSSGIPAFLPLAHSADLASVYAVARQESEFVWHAASGAGAKGLMQLLPSTAASTAKRAGVAYDYARLLVDPAFNTQLGAAFLGQVMQDVGGSRVMAFAAYNAGPGRVAQWIAAYGDPRNGVDPVDWVERIPFDETRDYVQRVSENLGVYRERFSEQPEQASLSPFAARE
jgi:soluble lytic murein transglycosylase